MRRSDRPRSVSPSGSWLSGHIIMAYVVMANGSWMSGYIVTAYIVMTTGLLVEWRGVCCAAQCGRCEHTYPDMCVDRCVDMLMNMCIA